MASDRTQKSSKGVPRKARSLSRKARRTNNLSLQPEKKLRHLLKRNTLREAFEWANANNGLATLSRLRPNYKLELRAEGHNV